MRLIREQLMNKLSSRVRRRQRFNLHLISAPIVSRYATGGGGVKLGSFGSNLSVRDHQVPKSCCTLIWVGRLGNIQSTFSYDKSFIVLVRNWRQGRGRKEPSWSPTISSLPSFQPIVSRPKLRPEFLKSIETNFVQH